MILRRERLPWLALALAGLVLFCFVLFCFIFQDYCRAERSARRYILGETLLLRGRRPHLIQYILGIIGEAAEE